MLSGLEKERGSRVLLAGDLNSDLACDSAGARKVIRETQEKMKEGGRALILNHCGQQTTPQGSEIDVAITMGNWGERGFASHIECGIGSTRFPLYIGVSVGENGRRNQDY